MKAWGSVLILLIAGSFAAAESLGEVAKRERERREKTKQAGSQPKVIDSEGLIAGRGNDSKGTFNSAAGPTRGGAGVASPSPSSAPTTKGGGRTDVDIQRAAAMDRLEASYAKIAATVEILFQAFDDYSLRCTTLAEHTTNSCRSLAITVDRLTITVVGAMTEAEEAARQGWLPPGEVRAARQRHDMDDLLWDKLVRVVQQRRR